MNLQINLSIFERNKYLQENQTSGSTAASSLWKLVAYNVLESTRLCKSKRIANVYFWVLALCWHSCHQSWCDDLHDVAALFCAYRSAYVALLQLRGNGNSWPAGWDSLAPGNFSRVTAAAQPAPRIDSRPVKQAGRAAKNLGKKTQIIWRTENSENSQ